MSMLMNRNTNILVAGAGLWGCTVARLLADLGYQVTLCDKESDIGGTLRCKYISGIEVHRFGPHIFNTDNEDVYHFISRFSSLNNYHHTVLSNHKGVLYPLPIGLHTVNQFFHVTLRPDELSGFLTESRMKSIIDTFVRPYSEKQWGRSFDIIEANTVRFTQCRNDYETSYFPNAKWQGIPEIGYTALISRIVNHKNIKVSLDHQVDLHQVEELQRRKGTVFFSGPIDQLFGYTLGHLPWRGIRFELQTIKSKSVQGCAVVNYPALDVPFTRQTEYKFFRKDAISFHEPNTVVGREYPFEVTDENSAEPVYPILNAASRAQFQRYKALAPANIYFGGRLGGYRYVNMSETILDAMATVNKFIACTEV